MKRWFMFLACAGMLLFLLLPACGGDGEEKTLTPTRTVTPVQAGPVKIGAMTAWSGPMAMSGTVISDPIIQLVEKQVKDQGGILGGREVKIIKFDTRGSVADAAAGATKLYHDDKVSAIAWGGAMPAEAYAVMDFADDKILVSTRTTYDVASRKFAINCTIANPEYSAAMPNVIINVIKPKTVAILGTDSQEIRVTINEIKLTLESAGIKIVQEQYAPANTVDYSPYLSKVKYANPDVLLNHVSPRDAFPSIAKQLIELGGLSDIKMVTWVPAEQAVGQPGAEGWYIITAWLPGLTYPGALKFEKDYQDLFGKLPNGGLATAYNSLWLPIKAVELANSDDPIKIAEAARSGKLEWDSPNGHIRISAETGRPEKLNAVVGHVEGGKMVLVPMPD